MLMIEGLPSRYRVEEEVGKGAFGKVYRAFDSHTNSAIAIKLLSRNLSYSKASFMREFRVLSKLQHRNLVRVHDFGRLSPGLLYFTMEYIEGANLRSYLKESANLKNIPRVLDQILDALSYLHRNGIVHGDIKPENIMIAGQEDPMKAKLLDFGLSSASIAQETKKLSGTLRFLAPEIFSSEVQKNPATDLYALGASFIESIEDSDFPSSFEITDKLLGRRYAMASTVLAKAGIANPSSLTSFIFDLCKPDPLQRPVSAEAASSSIKIMIQSSDLEKNQIFTSIFINREKEINEIRRFLRSQQTRNKALILRGPRGIGKKCTIRRVIQSEQLKRRIFFDLSSLPYDYFSTSELVQLLISQSGSSEKRILLSQASAISSSAQSLKEISEADAIGRRSLVLFNHIIDAIQEISSHRSVVLFFPDIDRLGKDHCRFVNQILNHLELMDSNIKLLMSLNNDVHLGDDADKIVAILKASQQAAIIDMQGFSEQVLADYLIGIFGERLLSERECKSLRERTGGIPLIIEAAIRYLISANIVRFEQGRWLFDRAMFARSDLRIGSEHAFNIALENLNKGEIYLLEVLAILNHEISLDRMKILMPPLVPSWEIAARRLVDYMIIAVSTSDTISFAHPYYRELILKTCSNKRVRNLNEQIANYLAIKEPQESLRIARHYIAAEDLNNGMVYSLKVLENLYVSYMPYDCLKIFTDLSDLAARIGTRKQMDLANACLAPIQIQTGLLREAIETYSSLISSDAADIDKANFMIQKALLLEVLGNSTMAIKSMRAAQHFITKRQVPNLMAHTYYHLSDMSPKWTIHYLEKALPLFKYRDKNMYLMTIAKICHRYKMVGKIRELQSYRKLLVKEMRYADENAKKEIYRLLASICFVDGDYNSQRYYLENKLEIERKQDNAPSMVQSMTGLAGHYYAAGNISGFISMLEEANSLCIRYNQLLMAVNIHYNLILAYRMLGDYNRALRMIDQIEQIVRQRKITQIGSVSYIKPAQLFALLGRAKHKEFEASAAKLYRAAQKIGNAISLGHYNMCYSTYHHINRRYRRALLFVKKAIELFKKAEDRDDIVLALIQKSIILSDLGATDEAGKNIKQAEKIYDEIHCEYLKPFLIFGKGSVARNANDERARQLLADGLRASKRMGTKETTWQIQRELALYHRDHGEYHKALDYFQDAIDTLKQITETLDDEKLKVSYLEVPIRKRIFDEIKDLKKQLQRIP